MVVKYIPALNCISISVCQILLQSSKFLTFDILINNLIYIIK